MAKAKFSRSEFEKYVKITPEIQEKIRLFGTPLESVTDQEIEIEIFPNRPDLLSLQGYVRAFRAFLGKETGLKKYKLNKQDEYKVIITPEVKDVRPFTACAVVKNLHFDDEKIKDIIDIQEKLHSTLGRGRKKLAIGIYPLPQIKFPVTYTAKKPQDIMFLPLEAKYEMSAVEILKKHPTGKEYAHLLENYDKYPVFIDANKKVLSMPPIINSHQTGKIDTSTKEVFVECSGHDFPLLKKTLNIIITSLADMGGKLFSVELIGAKKEFTPDLSAQKIKVSLTEVNKLLGLDLKDKDLEKLLARMGHEYKSGSVLSPPYRIDLLHQVDIIEDVAIAYGYDNFVPQMLDFSTVGEESEKERIKRKIAEVLIGLQIQEISTYHLIRKKELENAKSSSDIEVESSKTDYKFLRPNLFIPALRIFSENKDNEYPQKVFELGTVFARSERTETMVKESDSLLIAFTPGNFTLIKQALDHLTKSLNLQYILEEKSKDSLINGRSASIKITNREVGYIGEVHPDTLQRFNIKMPVSILEINVDDLVSLVKLK